MSQRKISKLSSILHSIPILLNRRNKFNNKLRYISYSIPLVCMAVLLFVVGSMLIINSDSLVYAEGENDGISTYAVTSVNPTVSLTIGGDATNKQVITSPGSVGYRSHTVTVEASDIESYSLIISGPTNLTSGTSTLVSGAGGKTPAAMSDNTWGYSWGDTSTTKESSTYQTLSPSGDSLSGDNVSSFGVNFTRNLFFAAKFSEDADSGRYRANVTLSLAATPRAIATGFGGIVDMQNMTGAICASVPIGTTGSLEDIRDQSVYTVAKLSDGNCWMTQNLRIAGGTVMDRTNTDLDSSIYTTDSQTYTLPAATDGGFSKTKLADSVGEETYMNHQVRDSVNNDYGAYYSWCVATAGTCQIGNYADIQPKKDEESGVYYTANPANTMAVPLNEQATSSICPKGWRLPTSGASSNMNTNFRTLYRNYPNAQPSAFQANNGKGGYWLGGDSAANGGAFFPVSGYVDSTGLVYLSSGGNYASGTAGDSGKAYVLRFTRNSINPSAMGGMVTFCGYVVRCIVR